VAIASVRHAFAPMHDDAIQHLVKSDAILARTIDRIGPCTLKPIRSRSPYQSLVQAVAHQQLNGTAANTILRRFVALFPSSRFPEPEEILASADEPLRGAGFSRAKVASIKDIAARTLDGTVPTRRAVASMSNEEIIERLTAVRGVGPWTVEMLLIFTLGRMDVLPATDFGVRKGFARVYRRRALPAPAQILKHGERWRPYRSVASWYLWRSLDTDGD
jgi:DNA-3-methyladenine glycosylase II